MTEIILRAEPETYVDNVEHARELAILEDANRGLRAYGFRMAERLREEQTRQISADDYRLTDFWEEAHRVADEAGHCEVYDQLVERLGGPTRTIEVVVEVTYRVHTEMSRTEYARGDFDAAEIVENYADLSDPWRTESWEA
jgi:hypothetical protein